MRFRAVDEAIYIGDGGRTYCGEHLGSTASETGRDLSGQPIHRVGPADVQYCADRGWPVPRCEQCGREASALHLPPGRV